MKYKIFWWLAIPLIGAVTVYEWTRGVRSLVAPALVLSIIISYIWNRILEWKEDAVARERERLSNLCKHGNPRYKSCTPCAEEFAYWETCKLCGASWDTRKEKHDHTLHVEEASGSRRQVPVAMSHYSSQMSISRTWMPTYTSYTCTYPIVYPPGIVSGVPMSSLGHGAEMRMSR